MLNVVLSNVLSDSFGVVINKDGLVGAVCYFDRRQAFSVDYVVVGALAWDGYFDFQYWLAFIISGEDCGTRSAKHNYQKG